jgi:hypothetical protein
MNEEITDTTVLTRFPRVRLDHANKHYYRGLLRHELLVTRCADCGFRHTPPRPICPACWSGRLIGEPADGRGAVYLVTFLHQGPPGVAYPWPLAAVELIEQPGLRVTATLVGCEPAAMRPGLPVELTWIDRDGAPWPAFRPQT